MATELGQLYYSLTADDESLKIKLQEVKKLLRDANTEFVSLSQFESGGKMADAFSSTGKSIEQVVAQSKTLEQAFRNLEGGNLNPDAGKMKDRWLELQEAARGYGVSLKSTLMEQRSFSQAMGMQAGSIDQITAKMRALRDVRARENVDTKQGSANIQDINTEYRKLENTLSSLTGKQRNYNDSIFSAGRLAGEVKGQIQGYLSIYAAERFISKMIEIRGQFELQQTALRSIIQDKAAADRIFDQVVQLGLKSPFKTMEINQYVKQLAAYRIETDQLFDTTKRLADVSAGLGVDMQRLILAYGQVRAASVLRGTEVRQFTEAGIPLIDELAKKFSLLEGRAVSTGEVFERVSNRMVSFGMVKEVFEDMTNAGGIFFQMQSLQSETLYGKVQNLGDAFDLMFNKIGQANSGVLKGSVDLLWNMADSYDAIFRAVKSLVAAYGAYRAALVVNSILNKTFIADLTAQIALFGKLRTAALAHPYAVLAAGIALVATATYQYMSYLNSASHVEELYQESMKKVNDAIDERMKKVHDLIVLMKNESASEKERVDAFNSLKTLIPDITGSIDNYRDAIEKLSFVQGKAAEASKEWRKEELKKQISSTEREIEKLQKLTNTVKIGSSIINTIPNPLASVASGLIPIGYAKNLEAQKKALEELRNELKETEKAETDFENERMSLGWYSDVQKYIDENPLNIDLNFIKPGDDEDSLGYLGRIRKEYKDLTDKISEQSKFKNTTGLNTEELKQQARAYEEIARILGITLTVENSLSNTRDDAAKTAQEQADAQLKRSRLEMESAIKEKDIQNEIEQLRINGLEEGFEKEQAKIALNHKKSLAEIDRRGAEMVKAQQDIERRIWEESGKQGTFTVTTKTVADLSDTDNGMLDRMRSEAEKNFAKEQKDLQEKALYNYRTYAEERLAAEKWYQAERAKIIAAGGNEGNLAELDIQRDDKLNEIDQKFGERQAEFKAWSDSIVNTSLQGLITMLDEANNKLALARLNAGTGTELGNDNNVALYRAEIQALKEQIESLRKSTSETTDKSYKDWNRTRSVISKVGKEIYSIADSIGGAAGEILKFGSDITTSILEMIDGITVLAENSVQSTAEVGKQASTTIQMVEKASVILAVISAALKVISIVTDGLKSLKAAELEREEAQKTIIELQREYNLQLIETKLLQDDVWGENTLGNMINAMQALGDATDHYNEVLNSSQEKWEDSTGTFLKSLYKYGTVLGWFGLGTDKGKESAPLKENLRYVTKKSSNGFLGIGGNHTETMDLEQWVKENLGEDLFLENGRLNLPVALALLDSDDDRLAGQTRENLEALAESEKAIQAAEEAMRDYISGTFGQLGDEITNAIVNAFRNGTDAAEAFNTSMVSILDNIGAQIVRNFFIQKELDKLEESLYPLYEDLAKTGNTEAFTEGLGSTLNTFFKEGLPVAAAASEEFLEQWKKMAEENGFTGVLSPNSESESGSGLSASSRGISGVTQDTVSEALGQLRAFRLDIAEGAMSVKEISLSISSMVKTANDISYNIQASMLLFQQQLQIQTSTNQQVILIANLIREINDNGLKIKESN